MKSRKRQKSSDKAVPRDALKQRSGAEYPLVGRADELERISACLRARKNILLEGPVGVGKTHLALHATRELGRPVFRIDGDSRYSEQKLSGWFDPPTVIKQGFSEESFFPGPLVQAMRKGGVLFVNELNRLPEGVQNVLLPAIDERLLSIPRLGEIRAAEGFLVVATQNPKEFVATSHLSEAILDRFELVVLDYQSEAEEMEIVTGKLRQAAPGAKVDLNLARAAVSLARLTRSHPRVRRGASVRAAISVAEIATVLMAEGTPFAEAFLRSALMALPTRIEIEREAEADQSLQAEVEGLIREWVCSVLEGLGQVKKKT